MQTRRRIGPDELPEDWDSSDHRLLVKRLADVVKEEWGDASEPSGLPAFENYWPEGTRGERMAKAILRHIRGLSKRKEARGVSRSGKKKVPAEQKAPCDIKVGTLAMFARATKRNLAWLVSGQGAEIVGDSWERRDFESELASQVLAAMPKDAAGRSGIGGRNVAIVGSKCLDVAIEAARSEWVASEKFFKAVSVLNKAASYSRSALFDPTDRKSREKYNAFVRDLNALKSEHIGSAELRTMRPFPLPSDYMLPVDRQTWLGQDGETSEAASNVISRDESIGRYGYQLVLPPGHATRVPVGPRSVSYPMTAAEALQAKRDFLAQQKRTSVSKPETLVPLPEPRTVGRRDGAAGSKPARKR